MKKLIQTVGNLMLSIFLMVSLAAEASATGRVSSKEPVGASDGSTVVFVIAAIAVVAIAAAVAVIYGKRKKAASQQPSQVIIVPPAASASRHGATLEAQGSFLGGKHFGIVTHATIGRSSSADIRVDDPKISGIHCQVSLENGKLILMDMGSTNGTMLAGTGKISPKTKVPLANGSIFWLGEKRNAFRVVVK